MSVLGFFSPVQENGYLSNWYLCEFTYGRYTYSSAEQFMMAQKALLFQDFEIFDKIYSAFLTLPENSGRMSSLKGSSSRRKPAVYPSIGRLTRVADLLMNKTFITTACVVKVFFYTTRIERKEKNRVLSQRTQRTCS